MENPVIIILIVLIALFFVFFIVRSRTAVNSGKKHVPNYRALFILGLTWIPIGIATDNPGLWGMGIVFMLAGGFNKNKWGQETKWADMSPKAKKLKLLLVGGLTIALISLLLVYIFTKGN
jgi:hypothetical protein